MTDSIVVENLKEGTPREIWDAEASDQIEGFATDISVNHGTRVDFKINVNANLGEDVPYHIEIYRLGYYDGDGARLVHTSDTIIGNAQPDPLYDAATGLVDAGNWNVSTGWDVPSDAVSGVYLVKVVREDNGATNQIPFIVRDDDAPVKSDIILQTSDTTWQAYNGWAGNNGQVGGNFYGDPSGTINHPDVEDPGLGAQDRAYAVSYNRPFLTRDAGGAAAGAQDYLFGADYAAIYWLEKNGYDVSYISGVDTDRLGADYLIGHNAFISVGHDEYWSGEQRHNVEEARDEGALNLLFWSGNEVYWKTRLEPSISPDGTEYRTLVSYKETWANRDPNAGPEDYANIDPANDWTGTWRDMRFVDAVDSEGNLIAGGSRVDLHAISGSLPNCNCITGAGAENSLTGQLFGPDGTGQFGAALDVPAALAGLRVWRDTTVATTGQLDMAPGILGYEWNTSPEDDLRPAGLIKLSDTVDIPWNGILVDQGNTVQPGVATHNLSLYRAESGALVFGAGTVFWSWGLSNEHDSSPYGANIESLAIQQFTVNMFADMGIQPGVADAILASQGLVRASASTDFAAATTTMDIPDEVHALQTVAITGTATDDDGNSLTSDGRVAVVEVSVDGGVTWRVAEGTTDWSYAWRPTTQGSQTIMARAIDDSLNVANITPSQETIVVGEAVMPSTFSLFDSAAAVGANFIDNPAELGMRFTTDREGEITELRYFRSAIDSGDIDTRDGHLWRVSDGALLGTVNFTSNPGQSGWQIASLTTPVAILPGVEYVVSYHTNDNYFAGNGFFSPSNEVTFDGVDDDAFSDPFGVISAPQNHIIGNEGPNGNGVYKLGGSGIAIPDTTFQSSNYWVDITFRPFETGPNTSPSITSNGGGPTASVNVQENTTLVTTFTASDAESPPQVLTYTLGGEDAGLFHVVANQIHFVTAPNFESPPGDGATDGYQVTLQVSDGEGGIDTQDITVNISDINENLGSEVRIFDPSDTNFGPTEFTESGTLELGVKFESSVDGFITQLHFYKASGEIGTHVGHLWNANGTLLVSFTFENETASGWQTATLDEPFAITAGADYIASYTSNGRYVGTNDGGGLPPGETQTDLDFDLVHTSGPLTAFASGDVGGNGVFSAGGTFPTQSFNQSNYWVDVTFSPLDDGVNNAPVITGGDNAATNVAENSTAVTTVVANDPDAGQSPVYSISGGVDEALFAIDPDTGALSFLTAPDFETPGDANGDNIYEVIVRATDDTDSGLLDEQTISVTVTDQAEVVTHGFVGTTLGLAWLWDQNPSANPPQQLTSSSPTNVAVVAGGGPEVVAFPEEPGNPNFIGNNGLGLANIDIEATTITYVFPLDESLPEPLDFSNRPFNGPRLSDVNDTLRPITGVTIASMTGFTGDGLTASNIIFDENSIYVHLGGGEQRFDDATLVLNVTFANATPTIISSDNISVAENSTAVVNVAATDADTALYGEILTYGIVGGADAALFTINDQTGALSFINAPDFETDPHGYEVSVRVTDSLGATAEQNITVNLTDANDNAPVMTSSATPSVAENSTTVVDLTASDADTVGGPTTFLITGGADATQFQIAADGHTLEFVSAKDYETQAHSYQVEVTASDGSNSTPQLITVAINEANEFSVTTPVDTDATTNAVSENVAIGALVGVTAFASDADATNNAVTYSLSSNPGGLFAIDPVTGVVTTAAAIDREALGPSTSIEVTATSADGSSAAQSFSIAINEANEFSVTTPVDTDATTNAVSENVAIGALVGVTAFASDADATNNAVTYSLSSNPGGLFAIDPVTGVVTTAAAIDREALGPSTSIEVTATSADGSSAAQSFSIAINEANEFSVTTPVDTDATTNAVSENVAIGALVGVTAFASDADATNNAVTYSLSSNPGGLFAIDPVTGVVTTAAAIDREALGPSTSIEVTATSADGSSAAQSFSIAINEANEFSVTTPVDTDATTNAVSENVAIGALVGVTAFASDADATNNAVTYSLSSNPGGLFAIDPVTGVVTTAAAIDREALGPSTSIEVTATSADGSSAAQSFSIAINEANEFSVTTPVDTDATTNAVSENVAIGALVGVTAFASDADATNNAVTYSLSSNPGGLFAIDPVTGVVTTAAAIDREALGPSTSIEVTATSADGSSAAQSFSIAINEANEFSVTTPVDTDATTNAVSENVAIGALVGVTAFASDADATNNAVTYSLSSNPGGLFAIDPVTGVVTTAAAIDREALGPSTSIEVTATSADGSSAAQSFSIAINEANEFSVTTPVDTDATTNAVSENVAIGALVGVTAFASDADATNNAVTYSLSSNPGGLFAIDPVTGVVTTAAAIDREALGPSTSIEVTATSADGSSAAQSFSIAINEANEFSVTTPVDTDATTNAVSENVAIGALVGVTAFASDADATNNAVTYSLSSNPGGLFAIDPVTGVVTTAAAIDREALGPSTSIEVTATSADGSSAAQSFSIAINEANEFSVTTPVDTDATTNAVSENVAIGALVGVTAFASDADATNNAVTYSLSSNPGGLFAIDPVTGVVTTAAAIDREALGPSTSIEVTATSADGSSAAQSFSIAINEANEFSVTTPVDTDATTNAVSENVAIGALVGVTAFASDADATNNAVTYSLSSNPGGLFAIDPVTGVVTTAAAIDREALGPSTSIEVTATSADGSSAAQSFSIAINDVNDNAPVFTSSATPSVAENSTTVVDLTASDADTVGGPTTFLITGGADATQFQIAANGHTLEFVSAKDYETQAHSYAVQVTASDGLNPTPQNITVTLTDQNEGPPPNSPPAITSNGAGAAATISVAENTTAITTVTATDPNGQTPAYSISGGADAAKFSINAATGALVFAPAPDFETPTDTGTDNSYEVIVRASDGSLFDEQTLTVNVTNVLGITVNGTPGNNVINGTGEEDTLNGLGGNDQMHGLGGNDFINGGAGNDQLFGDAGNDTLSIAGIEAQGDTFAGGSGTDAIQVAGSSAVTLAGFNATASSIEIWQGNGQGVLGTSANNTFNLSGLSAMTGLAFIDGGGGNDIITGSNFADDLRGGSGNDTLNGGEGDDTLTGGVGNDALSGDNGDDTFVIAGTEAQGDSFSGGGGTNRILVTGTGAVTLAAFNAATSSIKTWQGNGQALVGTSANNNFDLSALIAISSLLYIDGAGGADVITGSAFADDLRGGAGNDTLSGGEANDRLTGGAGNDGLHGGNGDDTFMIAGTEAQGDSFDGGAGTDGIVVTGSDALTLAGFNAVAASIETWQGTGQSVVGTGAANILDFSGLTTVAGLPFVNGGGGNDSITGSSFADDLRGGSGDDMLSGGDGNDTLTGGAGTDTLLGGSGDDTFVISGTDGQNDIFAGGLGTDSILVTGSGAATLAGFNATASSIESWQGNGQGVLGTGAGNILDFSGLTTVGGLTFVDAGGGNDSIIGTSFAGDLRGGSGNDSLRGGAGNDTLTGGAGNDTLIGGLGADNLNAGAGNDVIAYQFANEGGDLIQGYSVAADTLAFSAAGFGGNLAPNQQLVAGVTFIANTAPVAASTDSTFLYDTDGHDLLWDADGSGTGEAVQVAHFDAAVALNANDFDIMA